MVEGVLIARVSPGTAAAEQGLEAGDVIVAIGGDPVSRADDASKKLDAAKADKRPVVLLISRQGITRFVVVKAAQSRGESCVGAGPRPARVGTAQRRTVRYSADADGRVGDLVGDPPLRA